MVTCAGFIVGDERPSPPPPPPPPKPARPWESTSSSPRNEKAKEKQKELMKEFRRTQKRVGALEEQLVQERVRQRDRDVVRQFEWELFERNLFDGERPKVLRAQQAAEEKMSPRARPAAGFKRQEQEPTMADLLGSPRRSPRDTPLSGRPRGTTYIAQITHAGTQWPSLYDGWIQTTPACDVAKLPKRSPRDPTREFDAPSEAFFNDVTPPWLQAILRGPGKREPPGIPGLAPLLPSR